jgi:hypothetical protein
MGCIKLYLIQLLIIKLNRNNGKVALKSNSPPGPLITSELEISIERLIIQNLYVYYGIKVV